MSGAAQADPLHVLREYRNLAPWNLRDLAGPVGAILDASAAKRRGGPPRGKAGRALTAWLTRDGEGAPDTASSWRCIPVGRGVELHLDAAHPLARVGPGEGVLADAVRQALAKLLPTASA